MVFVIRCPLSEVWNSTSYFPVEGNPGNSLALLYALLPSLLLGWQNLLSSLLPTFFWLPLSLIQALSLREKGSWPAGVRACFYLAGLVRMRIHLRPDAEDTEMK